MKTHDLCACVNIHTHAVKMRHLKSYSSVIIYIMFQNARHYCSNYMKAIFIHIVGMTVRINQDNHYCTITMVLY